MTGALLLTGGGELHDPWHPFPATSRRIAALLEADQVPTTIVDTVGALGDAVDGARLLVINAGSGIGPTPHDDALLAIVETHLAAGRGLLAVHATAGLLPGSRAWERALGGCWVPGVSDHPPLGDARVLLGGHELVDGLDEVHVVDERYTGLRVAPDATVIAWHEEGGARHPIAWVREAAGSGARVVYDALGHDERSYDSASRCALLRAEVRWLLAGR